MVEVGINMDSMFDLFICLQNTYKTLRSLYTRQLLYI